MSTFRLSTPRVLTLALAFASLTAASSLAQDVPQGVNYKKATPEINSKAKFALQKAISDAETPAAFLSDSLTCGPMLWNDLKATRESLAKESTPAKMYLSIPEQVQAEGGVFRTPAQRDHFWKLVIAKFPELRKGVIRPVQTSEVSFFWSTIPFDIEEPLFAIETPKQVFIANLRLEGGKIVLFWLDRVDDLHKLKN